MNLIDYVTNHSPPMMKDFFDQNIHIIEGISRFIEEENKQEDVEVTPYVPQIFSSLHLVSMDREGLLPNSLKVVIMLQDPYQQGCACGVAMSTLDGSVPVSLRNVNKVLRQYKSDIPKFSNGDIRGWCTQGVLLWNAALTTRLGKSKMHTQEWNIFSQRFVKYLSSNFRFLVFVLLGADAKAYTNYIDQSNHCILTTSHPVARDISNTFLTSDIFTKINEALISMNVEPIRWEDYSYIDTK